MPKDLNPLITRVVVLPTLTLLALSTASAQQAKTWGRYCTLGSFEACMTISITFDPFVYPLGTEGSHVTVAIQNLEGTMGSVGAWGFTGIKIDGLHTSAAYSTSPRVVETISTVGLEGTATTVFPQQTSLPDYVYTGALWDVYRQDTTRLGYIVRETPAFWGGAPIVGCTVPSAPYDIPGAQGYDSGEFQTCGDSRVVYSFDSYVSMMFTDQTQLTITGFGPDGASFSCTMDATCVPSTTSVSATPEPGTIAFVASGFVGLASIRLRRRRHSPF